MPYLKGPGNDFENTINRGIGHSRSKELDATVSAIKQYIKSPSADHVTNVRDRLEAWRKFNPKEYADRGQPIHDPLNAELKRECAHWRVPTQPAANVQPAVVAPSTAALPWVNVVRAQIEELGRYDCADAYLGTAYDAKTGKYNYNTGFAGCIPVAKRPEMERRFAAMKQRNVGGAGTHEAMFDPRRAWMPGNFATAYRIAKQNKAAICVQFAKASAHILTVNRPKGPRVEVVAFKNHVYVLVGRRGTTVNGMVHSGWLSESGVVVVDAWAGSLGYPTSIYSPRTFPLNGMVNPLKVVAERPAS